MPDEINIASDVKAALDRLEHYTLKNHTSRNQNYTKILLTLEKGEDLSLTETERLLAICVHDLREDMRYTATIMNIISVIISRVQMGKYNPNPNLLPSALAVIYITKTAALQSKVELLQQLCFDTLSSYPNDILIAASEHYQEVLEIFHLYCHNMRIPIGMRLKACIVLHKLLKILPPEIRRQFVEKGVSVWFSRVIPVCMNLEVIEHAMTVELLELLTEELIAVDYTDNQHWHYILESICSTQKYPAIMKTLLQKGSDVWHRIWILFIRLLKHQVTQPLGNVGTPINSMLPVVEAAFKVDMVNRCKAFQCWSVLIDSFSTETSESNINKRIKLLIIPLKSNNAKNEATALAKFECWWHLLEKFQNKMDKLIDHFLVSFLYFCFGKPDSGDKPPVIPGQITVTVKKQCIQALVEMVGHVNCDGCTDLPKLSGKLINTKNLVDNWSHWVFSLTSAFLMSANSDIGLTNQQMTCLWKSFLITIGELPENNIRKDLFSEILSKLLLFLKECESNAKYSEMVFNAILSLFDGDIRIKQLLKTREKDVNRPLCYIITLILDPSLKLAYQSCSFKEMVTKLRRVTDVLIDPVYSAPNCVVCHVLQTLTANDISLTFWTALAESIVFMAQNVTCEQVLCETILWPLQSISEFTHVKDSAMTWYTMYDLLHPKLKYSEIFEKTISKFLFNGSDISDSTIYFKLCVTLCVLRHKMTEQNCSVCENELEQLHIVTSRIDNYHNYEQLFPLLVDRVVATISIIVTNFNETAAQYILFCLKKMMNVMTLTCKQQTDASHILSFIDCLLKSLDSLIQVKTYQRFIPIIVDELLDCSSFLSQQPLTKNTVLYVMRTLKSKIVDETDITFKKIKALIDNIENETMAKEKNQNSDKNKFTTPKTKEVQKRTKKKEASIVNTVVENGEEYVVVKSNWKFNPRKLTENQKEKLKRKREDIPALYQDLSQSQDEFKLVSWKTDSQDTSNSSKSESKSCKSGSNETATEMLLSLPSSNVVPKILENFFAENINKDHTVAKDILPADKKVEKIETVTPKNTKSPRMALKDRVFRNVRNLIENSGVQKENKSASVDLNKTETIIKTPTQSKNDDTANIVNSAPPLVSADRPSRIKRKPKKFDELQLLTGSKKRRRSLQDLKSKCESMQSNPDTTPSKPDSAEDASPPIESVSNEDEVNDDGEVPENINISVNEVKSNENLQKDECDIQNETDITKEVLDIDIEIVNKNPSCLLLNDNMDTDKNYDITDEQKVESSFENNVERSTEYKVESSTEKKVENFAEKKVENFAEKKVNSCAEEKVESSAENKVESSTEKNVESSTENMVESSNDNKNEVSNNKKGETCNANKPKESNNDRKKLNDIQNLSSKDKSSDKKEETLNSKNDDKSSESETGPSKEVAIEPTTPQQESKNKGTEETKSTTKKAVRQSRIEKELAIDMVEGHPYLKMQTQKRWTRKALESAGIGRRKSLVEKLNKSKSEAKTDKKIKEKNKDIDSSSSNSSLTVDDSQGQDTEIKDQTSFTEDLPYSDDVIESSQDSSITTISVKSTKKASKRVPIVTLEKIKVFAGKSDKIHESQSILDCVMVGVLESVKSNKQGKDDSELPFNKTASELQSQADLTENLDTEPIEDLSEVIIIDNVPAPLTISSDETEVGPETQEIAEADTQPTEPNNFMEVDVVHRNMDTSLTVVDITADEICNNKKRKSLTKNKLISEKSVNPAEDITITLSDSAVVELEKESGASSPSSLRDDAKRRQDFLNNTLEISPIKNMSPERTKKSPSPDISGDYVVITLSSPVNSNGEPFEKCGSPEVFTEDKVSPDKRDQSPPRVEVTVTNTSPSSSLSLKKNRPQVRAGGRAAQMLGLCCVPDKVQAIINQEKAEAEEIKKNSTSNTPARRNLRILYNSVSENIEPPSENEDIDKFLKFRRSLPAVDSSPAGPILKRKLVEIADDATISPASKRKRVSFHDPPVSTTVSVQKYIEPGDVRSPQNSAHKRLERQLRQHTPLKSPKRLDHAFKLDTVLNRAVESFTVTTVISTPGTPGTPEDTQPLSLDATPVVEIVRASELNDTDPICPDLVNCKDPIDNISGELSSFAMKSLLVKELVGKVETVGDLAKMTELEVNRLCIKAPKVKVARKVLTDYASKRVEKPPGDVIVTTDEAIFNEPLPEPDLKSSYVDNAAQTFTNVGVETELQTFKNVGVETELQTFKNVGVETEVQTDATPTTVTFVQTESTPTVNTVVQTDESGSKSTADIVKSCLAERQNFVEQVSEHLENSSIQQITDKLPFSAITDVLMKKITPSDAKTLLNRVLENQWNNTTEQNHSNKELSFIREYMCDRFDPKDLILFCSEVLKSVHDKPVFS